MSKGESDKQRQSNGKAMAAEETSGDDALSETELKRQRRAANGNAPVEKVIGDDIVMLGEIFEEIVEAGLLGQKRQAKGRDVVVADIEEEEDAKVAGAISKIVLASKVAPKRLMNFDLCQPTEPKCPD